MRCRAICAVFGVECPRGPTAAQAAPRKCRRCRSRRTDRTPSPGYAASVARAGREPAGCCHVLPCPTQSMRTNYHPSHLDVVPNRRPTAGCRVISIWLVPPVCRTHGAPQPVQTPAADVPARMLRFASAGGNVAKWAPGYPCVGIFQTLRRLADARSVRFPTCFSRFSSKRPPSARDASWCKFFGPCQRGSYSPPAPRPHHKSIGAFSSGGTPSRVTTWAGP